jgi:hypothetical protein
MLATLDLITPIIGAARAVAVWWTIPSFAGAFPSRAAPMLAALDLVTLVIGAARLVTDWWAVPAFANAFPLAAGAVAALDLVACLLRVQTSLVRGRGSTRANQGNPKRNCTHPAPTSTIPAVSASALSISQAASNQCLGVQPGRPHNYTQATGRRQIGTGRQATLDTYIRARTSYLGTSDHSTMYSPHQRSAPKS